MKRHAFVLIVAGVLALGCSTTVTGSDAGTDLAVETTADSTPDFAPDVAPDMAPDVALDASDAIDTTAPTDVTADPTDAKLDGVGSGACPISCGAEQYCRYTYTTDAGCGMAPSGGVWTCVDFPPACGTGAYCSCLACACCKMLGAYVFSCAGP
jgi:hypothetical protein